MRFINSRKRLISKIHCVWINWAPAAAFCHAKHLQFKRVSKQVRRSADKEQRTTPSTGSPLRVSPSSARRRQANKAARSRSYVLARVVAKHLVVAERRNRLRTQGDSAEQVADCQAVAVSAGHLHHRLKAFLHQQGAGSHTAERTMAVWLSVILTASLTPRRRAAFSDYLDIRSLGGPNSAVTTSCPIPSRSGGCRSS